ncbi:TetR/AcrR family transcriptional regulator [Devosia rhizoryzae]|uniref:HTH tetR-type domain-containing protein n=1 Tax=Devosia rhizoryzae TaxID=2774137 RepID=A0ABX7C577_9HYPH|nr:hypothetical protein [Devosia rhizoryzae]QQR38414.1 hypothetical protein JI748_11560 [Devosia rhizoryzae]
MTDNRRDAIADAAIEIIATEGLRALTHRAIDGRLGYPAGSTSYYLRTRQALIEAVVSRLSTRTFDELGQEASAPAPRDADVAAKAIAALVVSMTESRPLDHLARYALRIDLVKEPDLHKLITDESPIRQRLLAAGTATLRGVGVPEPQLHAQDLVALVDDLIFDRLTNSRAAADPGRVISAYFRGLVTKKA